MKYFPLCFDLSKFHITIIGSGNISLAKLENISPNARNINVISDNITDDFKEKISLLNEKYEDLNIKIICDKYKKKYIKKTNIIISAVDDVNITNQIHKHAKKLNILINCVDVTDKCDFIFPAIVKNDNFGIFTFSDAQSPTLSKFIKQKIHLALPINFDFIVDFIKRIRPIIKNKLSTTQEKRLFWDNCIENLSLIPESKIKNINDEDIIDENIKIAKNEIKPNGKVYFISAGSGAKDLITLRSIKLLQKSDVILYDNLVGDGILEYCRRDSIKIFVGKKRGCHSIPQEEINKKIVKYSQKGNIVARVKGGDCLIYSNIVDEILSCRRENINYEISAGVSAVNGCLSELGIPLTSRYDSNKIQILTIHKKEDIEKHDWKNLALSDQTLVFYMSLLNMDKIIDKLLNNDADKNLPIMIIENGTKENQRVFQSILKNAQKEFSIKEIKTPSIIIVGKVIGLYGN